MNKAVPRAVDETAHSKRRPRLAPTHAPTPPPTYTHRDTQDTHKKTLTRTHKDTHKLVFLALFNTHTQTHKETHNHFPFCVSAAHPHATAAHAHTLRTCEQVWQADVNEALSAALAAVRQRHAGARRRREGQRGEQHGRQTGAVGAPAAVGVVGRIGAPLHTHRGSGWDFVFGIYENGWYWECGKGRGFGTCSAVPASNCSPHTTRPCLSPLPKQAPPAPTISSMSELTMVGAQKMSPNEAMSRMNLTQPKYHTYLRIQHPAHVACKCACFMLALCEEPREL